MTFLDRLDRFRARRIEEADEAEQDEVLRQIGRAEASGLDAGIGQPRQSQHAFALSREHVGAFSKKARSSGSARRVLLPVAMRRG